MNQETLSHIANQNEALNADNVLDLVQMCQTFPYFHVPYIILSKHYSSKNDFRTENTLFQAALRTPDRKWLFDYISGNNFTKPEVEKMTSQASPPNLPNETIVVSEILTQEITIQQETEIENSGIPENMSSVVENIRQISETVVWEPIEIPKVTIENLSQESQLTERTNDLKYLEPDNDLNKESISKSAAFIAPEKIKPTFNKEPESMLFVPSIEPEVELDTHDLDFEKSTRSWFFVPEIPKVDDSTTIVNQPSRIINKTQPLTFSIGYNIEDYFKLETPSESEKQSIGEIPSKNTDFFSWLNSGILNQGPINKPTEPSKSNLIDKFIQEKPSIQRPKKEFFSPERAMKKSEVLDMGIVTETLANIYIKQGYPDKALKVYQQLQLKFPEKLSYFASLIIKLKQEHNL